MPYIQLPNECYCSALTVYPPNYKQSPASMKVNWYISYRFYDPAMLDRNGKIKPIQRIVKGMNDCKLWPERKAATAIVLKNELELLREEGFNPFFNTFTLREAQGEIHPELPFLEALATAKEKLKAGESVLVNLKSILTYVEKAARQLNYHRLEIGAIRRKHMKTLLDHLGKVKETWSANTYNHYRSHLSMLFTELLEWDAVEFNPLRDIKKQKHLKRLRQVLTDEERQAVKEHLTKVHPAFLRAVSIFFGAGVRETELLDVQQKDVDLVKERFKITLKKGGQFEEQWRSIKKIDVPLWKEVCEKAAAEDYIFSYGFKPGKRKAADDYFTKGWYRYVKNKKMHGIGITADMYSLKHLHTGEIVDLLDEEKAAKHNGHTSTAMVRTVYDVKNEGRKPKKVKEMQNSF